MTAVATRIDFDGLLRRGRLLCSHTGLGTVAESTSQLDLSGVHAEAGPADCHVYSLRGGSKARRNPGGLRFMPGRRFVILVCEEQANTRHSAARGSL